MSGCVLAALAALLITAAPAAAGPVTTSGSLLIRWQSNAETCGEHGLCGRSGSLSWRPSGDAASSDIAGSEFAFITVIGPDAVTRSYRGDSASCIDHSSSPVDIVGEPGATRGQLVFSMRRSDTFSSGRCAGPLARDLMQALPVSPPVSTAKLRSGRAVIDLRSRTPFSSGPFQGEVISTLVLHTHREPKDESSRSFSGTLTRGAKRGRRLRYGVVTAAYAINSFRGDAGYAFSGAPEPECAPFDTCGMSGEVMLHPDVHSGRLTVTTVRRLTARARETAPAGLRAMRHGRTNVFGDTLVGPLDDTDPENPFGLPLTEIATPGGGDACADSGSYREPDLRLRRVRGGLLLRLGHGGNTDPDPLRTRCPGPAGDDVGALAAGTLPLASVGSKQITLTLRPRPSFTAVGFRGAGRGVLQLTLQLQSLRAITRTRAVTREEGL